MKRLLYSLKGVSRVASNVTNWDMQELNENHLEKKPKRKERRKKMKSSKKEKTATKRNKKDGAM